MDSCLGTVSKYFLFITNFLIFALGIAVLSCGIWVLVDQPSFFDILDDAHDLCKDGDTTCDDIVSNLSFYSSATYIMIVIAALVILIAFFGCCGAMKESKCLLGTYFTIILALFIVMLIGAILGYSGNFEDTIKTPFEKALKKYNDQPDKDDQSAQNYKSVWNEVQAELKCCGIDSFKDWQNTTDADFNFPINFNKPEGCCIWGRDDERLTENEIEVCRADNPNDDGSQSGFYFKGCYTAFTDKIESNQDLVIGLAIGIVAVMFLNILFSFALCMTVKS